MRALFIRTAMIGGGLKYEVYLPVKECPQVDKYAVTTIVRDGKEFYSFLDGTLPESYFQMEKGWDRYEQLQRYQEAAKGREFSLIQDAFPETRQLRKPVALWAFGLMENETSKEFYRTI